MIIRQLKSEKGVTLIELSIALGVLLIVTVSVFAYVNYTFTSQRRSVESLMAQETTRKALEEMSDEVREANQAENGSYTIESATANSIVFFADVDNDNQTERLRYYLNGNNLERGIIEPTGSPSTYPSGSEAVTVLLRDLTLSPTYDIFEYHNKNYNGTQAKMSPIDLAQIRHVKVTVKVDPDPNTPPDSYELYSNITFRNLKDNL